MSKDVKQNRDELRELCLREADIKYGKSLPKCIVERIEQELSAIQDTRIPEGLLWLHKCFSNSNLDMEFWQLRGTRNNSILFYLLGMSNIDPIKHTLPYQLAYVNIDAFTYDTVSFRTSQRQLLCFLTSLDRNDYRKVENPDYPRITSRYIISNNGVDTLAGIYFDEEINGHEIIVRDKEQGTFSFIIEVEKNLTTLELLGIYSKARPTNNIKQYELILLYLEYLEDADADKLDEVFGQDLHSFIFNKYKQKYPLRTCEDWINFFNLFSSEGWKEGSDGFYSSCNMLSVIYKCCVGRNFQQMLSIFYSRENLFKYLCDLGLPKKIGIKLAEDIRKGRLTHNNVIIMYIESLASYNIPQGFWDICNHVYYLAPKAEGINKANIWLKLFVGLALL